MSEQGTNIEANTEADTEIDKSNSAAADTNEPQFFPVSEGKLITLYLLSFGLYGIYWFYQNWTIQQPKMDKKIMPLMRAIFSIFFTHSLFRIIDKSAEHLDKEHKFNANVLATVFVAAIVVSNVIDRLSLNSSAFIDMSSNTIIITSIIIFFFSVYPIVKVQGTVNRINGDLLGYLNYKYSIWNYLLMAIGISMWALMAMGLLAESMGLVIEQ